ncbi:MAG: FAD-dependent oxidoreductase [Steroidobacteraceae bacterium]
MDSGDVDYEVIVIGGGGAGMAAAIESSRAGARTLLVESDRKLGGSTALSGGVFYAAGTSLQRACGIDDTPEAQFRYYMNVNQHKLEAGVVYRLCQHSAPTFEWLVSLGVEFDAADLYVSGVDGIRRGHRARGHGAAIGSALEAAVSSAGVDVALNTRIRELAFTAGRVSGIVTTDGTVSAQAVVVATGGFGNNPSLLQRLYPDATRYPEANWYIGTPHALGDGLVMGEAVGAALTGHNRGLLLLTTGFTRDLEPYLPGWLVYVNREGRRFIDETTEYSVLAEVLKEQPGAECFALFDEATRRAATQRDGANWDADRLAGFIAEGLINRGETLEALATRIGVKSTALLNTLERYNADCQAGLDGAFLKEARHLRPLTTPPFYAAPIKPAVICWTGTGLRIDPDARVLDQDERAIPGLYAAGETTGGMFGPCYAAGGASVGNAIVFGRIAGQQAARSVTNPS